MTGSSTSGFAGQKSPTDSTSKFNAQVFLIQQLLGYVRTITVAKIMAVHNADVIGTPPTVDVQPAINMLDGLGQSTDHATIFGLPYFRLQGGLNAVLTPPKKDDFVIILVSDRDIASFKKNLAISNPGSFRTFDFADGIALGGICNGNTVPTQYLRFKLDGDGNPAGLDVIDALGNKIETSANGLKLTDKFGHIINMKSDGIAITGDVTITGKLTSSDTTGLAGGAKKVVLDGDPVSGGVVHATSTKTTAT